MIRAIGATVCYAGFGYAALARVGVLARALRRPRDVAAGQSDHLEDDSVSVTFMVPARREHLVIDRALRSMLACEHSAVVMAVVDASDPSTLAAVGRADDGSGRLRVILDKGDPPGKGRALTAALSQVDTEVVAVFDADSVVHPRLLCQVAPLFRDGADVVQVPVQPTWDSSSAWHGVRTLLDYAAWSRGVARVPTGLPRLSGTGIFFRTDLLMSVGGWRPMLTEDFDLAIRLTAAGARIVVMDCPAVATLEEVPHSAVSLLRQRIRWHQGFLEILALGGWREPPVARTRLSALGPLLVPVARVLTVTGAGFLLVGRFPAGLVDLGPAACLAGVVLTLDCLVFARVAPQYGITPSVRHIIALVLGAVPFYGVSAAASTVAVWRELLGTRTWETTNHGSPAKVAWSIQHPGGILAGKIRELRPKWNR